MPNICVAPTAVALEPHEVAAAAPSAIAQLPGTAREAFAVLSDLVRQLPCFLLHTGSEPASIPPLIAGWLERHR
jgi:hypothetical protein